MNAAQERVKAFGPVRELNGDPLARPEPQAKQEMAKAADVPRQIQVGEAVLAVKYRDSMASQGEVLKN